MTARTKNDIYTKEGSGRVQAYYMTHLPHCYTLEINYNTGNLLNKVPPKFNKEIRYV